MEWSKCSASCCVSSKGTMGTYLLLARNPTSARGVLSGCRLPPQTHSHSAITHLRQADRGQSAVSLVQPAPRTFVSFVLSLRRMTYRIIYFILSAVQSFPDSLLARNISHTYCFCLRGLLLVPLRTGNSLDTNIIAKKVSFIINKKHVPRRGQQQMAP